MDVTIDQQSNEEFIAQLQARIAQQETIIGLLHEQLRLSKQKHFGRKSEKDLDDKQTNLFDEAKYPENIKKVDALNEQLTIAEHTRNKKNKANPKKNSKLPDNLPRRQVIHDLSDAEKICPCGCELTYISDEVSEQLEIIPASVTVIENRRRKYHCAQCKAKWKTSKLPKALIPKSIATPSLLAHVAVSKYCDHLPLYRQESIFKRSGIAMPRMTLSTWVLRIGALIQPLINLMKEHLNHYDVAYADETPVNVLKINGKKNKKKAYMWLFIGGPPKERCYLYHYAPSRSGDVPMDYLCDFKGYLHADGYSGYSRLFAQGHVKHVGCFAHARRKFADIVKIAKVPGLAHDAVEKMAELYKIEKHIKAQAGWLPDKKKAYRVTHATLLLDELHDWLTEHSMKTPPKSAINNAIHYSLNQWSSLIRYLDDGRLDIDNNLSERGIKPFVIGRKNWLFMGNDKGARASANLFSLIETAKAHGLNPFDYLQSLFKQLPLATSVEDIEALLPYSIKNHLPQE